MLGDSPACKSRCSVTCMLANHHQHSAAATGPGIWPVVLYGVAAAQGWKPPDNSGQTHPLRREAAAYCMSASCCFRAWPEGLGTPTKRALCCAPWLCPGWPFLVSACNLLVSTHPGCRELEPRTVDDPRTVCPLDNKLWRRRPSMGCQTCFWASMQPGCPLLSGLQLHCTSEHEDFKETQVIHFQASRASTLPVPAPSRTMSAYPGEQQSQRWSLMLPTWANSHIMAAHAVSQNTPPSSPSAGCKPHREQSWLYQGQQRAWQWQGCYL